MTAESVVDCSIPGAGSLSLLSRRTYSNLFYLSWQLRLINMALQPAFRAAAEMTAHGDLKRTQFIKRHITHGAIAGTVVACVVAVFLLAVCLYPFLVRRLRRSHRSADHPLDTENGMTQTTWASNADDRQARPSSSDSSKRNDLSPRDLDEHSIYEQTRESNEPSSAGTGRSRQVPIQVETNFPPHNYAHNPTLLQGQGLAFSPFGQEFFPANTVDPEPGVLKGTNADYYSPSIPSELFGMQAEPVEGDEESGRPSKTMSRSSSIMQMLRGRSGKKRTMSGASRQVTSIEPFDTTPQLADTMSMEPIGDGEAVTASPSNVTEMPIPARHDDLPSIASIEGAHTPPQSPQNLVLQSSPSPPLNPAPGTVNPMDIMPASSQTESYYQTEQALNYFNSSPPVSGLAVFNEIGRPPVITSQSPSPIDDSTTQLFHTAVLLPVSDLARKDEGMLYDQDAMVLDEVPAENSLRLVSQTSDRRTSITSEVSTPFHGAQFTDPSSHNTPATQLDSPVSNSLNGSEFRHSESPLVGTSVPSPKDGRYYCDRCDRSFTQHHKLKYVFDLRLT